MATSIKLKSDIKKIEAAIKSKATPKSLVPKLQAQLEKIKDELASLNSPKPKKGVTKTKVLSSLQKLKAKVKSTKSLAGYKKSGIDLKKDAEVPALPLGKRYSQTTGNPYYEYRLNRADVKQPPKRYPKLEDGGMMAKGGGTKAGTVLKFDYNGMVFYDAKELFDVIDANVTTKKVVKFDAEVSVKQYATKYVGMSIDFTPDMSFNEFYNKLVRENSEYIWTSRIKKGGYMEDGGMMAKGGGTKAGTVLKFDYNGMVFYDAKELFDVIDANVTTKKVVKFDAEVSVKQYATKYVGMSIDFTPDMSFNEFYNKLVRENSEYIWTSRIKKGGYMEDGGMMDENFEYASGGRLKSAVNRDRAYKSDEAWEQSYKRKSRPKNPKYDTSDKGIFEKGGYMAMGGALEHGLMVGDVVKRINGNVIDVYNEKTNDESVLDISNGKRVVRFPSRVNVQQYEFAQGGELHRLEQGM